MIFFDIDPGKVVTAFTFECDLRIGNPQTTGPADGFSVNFARSTDAMGVRTIRQLCDTLRRQEDTIGRLNDALALFPFPTCQNPPPIRMAQ